MSAKTEAKCNLPNGIGIVKLMGRSAGYIAGIYLCLPLFEINSFGYEDFFLSGCLKKSFHSSLFSCSAHATLASSDVDLCLVPEVAIVLEGETGCLPFLMRRVEKQGNLIFTHMSTMLSLHALL